MSEFEFVKQYYHTETFPCGNGEELYLRVALCTQDPFSWHCGYITLPEGVYERLDLDRLTPHGGITYNCTEEDRSFREIGFDCAHGSDSLDPSSPQWRDYAYVAKELKALARQILAQLS